MRFFKILRSIFAILLVLILIVCLVQRVQGAHHPKIFGCSCGLVLTESMEPNLPAGSFIIIHEEDFQENDIITYNHHSGISVTHRVIAIDENVVKTQGDANKIADPAFQREAVVGKVIYHFNVLWVVIPVLVFIFTLFAFDFKKRKN